LQSDVKTHPARIRQLTAVRYYLQEVLWRCERSWQHGTYGVSNYRTFIDQIAHWTKPEEQVCLVTFNYDRLLEAGMPAVGLNIRQFPDYISDQKFKLIKLHGSINWARLIGGRLDGIDQMSGMDVVNAVISRAGQLEISNDFWIGELCPITKDRSRMLLPAIAVPVQDKTAFECPESHFNVLLECIPNVSRLLIVGWRGVENHFKNLLAERLTSPIPTHIVAGSVAGGHETLGNLNGAGIRTAFVKGTTALYEGGFSAFVVNRAAKDFLCN